MYIPAHYRESRTEVLHEFIGQHPLAVLVATVDGTLTANHIPMRFVRSADNGQLTGHIARANSLWRLLPADAPVLAVFRGAEHYVSPRWYPSKREHGKVVPTWNYSAVHVAGRIRFIDDAKWLRAFVESLTDEHERGSDEPWRTADAPADYLDAMLRAIVGFEIAVTGIEGKFKANQKSPGADREGVAEALRAEGLTRETIAELVREPNT
jgi:transcriptional regulator